MTKSLVIVESPAKAKTINKYLGKDFIVKSSVGHVRDLPTKALGKVEPKKPAKELKQLPEAKQKEYLRKHEYLKLVDRMGVDPENDWQAQLNWHSHIDDSHKLLHVTVIDSMLRS